MLCEKTVTFFFSYRVRISCRVGRAVAVISRLVRRGKWRKECYEQLRRIDVVK